MRDIEFRGKRIDSGEWVEGGFTLDAIDKPRITVKDGDGLIFHKVIPESVGQYTGLKDKNGVKIFEGDIVKRPPDERYGEDEGAEVEFVCGAFCINDLPLFDYVDGDIDDESHYADVEVIGNIHDNPELLQEAK